MEKGKRKRMETRATDFSKTHDQIPSSFFKIMLGDFKHFLHIPLKLAKTIGCLDKQTVILRDSNGQSWRVKLSVVDGRLAFCEGWDDFVLDHSINCGQFIVFKLIEKFVIRVRIFGMSTCEIIDFDEKRNKKSTGIKRKTTEKTFEGSGFGSKIDKARKEKTSTCNLKVLKTNDKGSEHVSKIYSNKVSPIVNEKRNNKSTGVKRKVTEKTFEVSGLGCKIDNRHALKKVRKENNSTSNLKVQKTIEKSSEHVNNTVRHVVISESSGEHLAATKIPVPLGEMPCDIAKKLGEDETNAMCSSEKSCSWDTLEDAIALEVVARKFLLTENGACHIVDENIEKPVIDLTEDESRNCRLRSLKIDKEPQGNEKIEKPIIDLTEDESRNYRLRSLKIGDKSQGNENIEKLIIDLTEDESRNYRLKSSKIGKKSQRKGIPCKARIQDHHNHSHNIQRYCLRSESKNKFTPFLKRDSVQVKLENRG